MAYEDIPPDQVTLYEVYAEAAFREATAPVLNKLGEAAADHAQYIADSEYDLGQIFGPVYQAEKTTTHDAMGPQVADEVERFVQEYQPLAPTTLPTGDWEKDTMHDQLKVLGLNDKAFQSLAGNYQELDPHTQNRLFDEGFIDGKGSSVGAPKTAGDIMKVADVLRNSSKLYEQIAGYALLSSLGMTVEDLQQLQTPPRPDVKAQYGIEGFGPEGYLTIGEEAKLAELDQPE